jgi:hypothetical protein
VYVASPVYVAPPPAYYDYGYTYSAPVYTTRSYYCSPNYYYGGNCGYGYGGYARPRYYYYGGGSYYCR